MASSIELVVQWSKFLDLFNFPTVIASSWRLSLSSSAVPAINDGATHVAYETPCMPRIPFNSGQEGWPEEHPCSFSHQV